MDDKKIHRLKNKKDLAEIILMIFAASLYFLARFLKNYPFIVEQYYSDSINKTVRAFLSQVTGIVPFSIAEIFVWLNFLIGFFAIFILLYKMIRGGGAISFLRKVLKYILVLYILFMALWGFNYSRISVADMNGLEMKLYSKAHLFELCEELVQKANFQREIIKNKDISKPASQDFKRYIDIAPAGYKELSKHINQMSGNYAVSKPVMSSPLMLYTGITGIYMPYTAEANVNIATPLLLFPSTVMHEMAHQRGIGPEDEANYIAYLACEYIDDDMFRYSGTMLALIHSVNALYQDDKEMAEKIRDNYSDQVNDDLKYYAAFWKNYEGKANDTADRINDTYLKANNQPQGVKSYGKMVDLLLAHYYQKGSI